MHVDAVIVPHQVFQDRVLAENVALQRACVSQRVLTSACESAGLSLRVRRDVR